VKIWGIHTELLKVSLVLNVSPAAIENKSFEPPVSAVEWEEKVVKEKNHIAIREVPEGTHVIIVRSAKGELSSVTHLVTWL
jgi:hypothetical protein